MRKTDDPRIQKMGQEVFDLLLPEEKVPLSETAFLSAFKKTAPRNKVFFSENNGSYGYFLRETKREVKRLVRNKQNTKTIRVPELDPREKQYNLPLG